MSILKIVRLKEKEQVVAIVRHSPIVYVLKVVLALALVSAPFFFMIPLFALKPWGAPVGLVIFGISVFLGAFFAVRILVIWYWNAFIITDVRVVDVDQRGLFDRVVSEATYDKVQDVSYHVKGFWGTILNYGTIIVQTAGAATNLELYFVRDPKEVHHLITVTMSAYRVGSPTDRNEKVSALLEAAANLSDAEARAFLTELKTAVEDKPESQHVDPKDVADLMTDRPGTDK